MVEFDPDALQAAAESARLKSAMGSNATDQLAPASALIEDEEPAAPEAINDLRTRYMGLQLRNPLVASAGPLSQTLDGIKSLAGGGVGAIVMYSLFEEQIRHEAARETEMMDRSAESFAEALSYFPTEPSNESGLVHSYLQLIEKAAPVIDVPLIASLNGSAKGEWSGMARRMVDAGASGIELNIYYLPEDLQVSGREVEQRYVDIVADVKQKVSVPVAVKLSPFFSSFGEMARRLDEADADALVLFNRFLQPDIDLDQLQVVSGFDLSNPDEAKLPRSWISALYRRVSASLAASTGVETTQDVVKYLLAGADVVMTTAALVRNGSSYAGQLVDGVTSWLNRRQLTLNQARGMLAVPAGADADEYARSGYVSGLERAKKTYAK